MIQFYAPDIESTGVLPAEESAHCVRVLRKREGEEIRVTDGRGGCYLCEITDANVRGTRIKIKEKKIEERSRKYKMILGVAPTKNAERMEWLSEKGVELGVDKIVLLRCARSERKAIRTDRLRKIMISAMNQSLGTRLPELEEVTDFTRFLEEDYGNAQKFFGYCSDSYPRKELAKECEAGRDTVVMVGPEGDFTLEEVEAAVDAGFAPVTFGDSRLRTETAGLFAICCVSTINQRLK